MNLEQFDWSAEEYEGLFEKIVPTHLLQNPLMQKDVWLTIDDLNLKVNAHHRVLSLNFEALKPDWLKVLVKLCILIKAKPNTPVSTAHNCVICLIKFSIFLVEKNLAQPKQINNQIFEEYEYYLVTTGLKSKSAYLSKLSEFFNVCRREGWLDINTYWFKGKCKKARLSNDKINYIPEEVWHQLEENLCSLPEQLQRMILLIKTTGLRVGELLNLPLDCLRKRGNQWRLRLTIEKYDVEDEIPIAVPELVTLIKEQQIHSGINWHRDYKIGEFTCPRFKKEGDKYISLCDSRDIVLDGLTINGKQKFACNSCDYRTIESIDFTKQVLGRYSKIPIKPFNFEYKV